ncbi:DUF4335 domain-containing protein [Nostoc sp. CHAB 5844]|nr:DUF4335 domain-containing protein [Nostoc sp. CHAB 5844]
MPVSNSVIRRYTPPTCTLEVLAQSSPLSRWMGKTVIKQLSFELRIDDPRLPEERRVVIRGDRDQLEALCDAVTSYVQQFLQQSPESFWIGFSDSQDSTKISNNVELNDVHQSSLSTQTLKSFTSDLPRAKIYLEPSSSLTHKLHLGSLASQATSPFIQLSLLQLFDLASALDEYSADVLALPALNTTSSVLRFPAWTPVAAVLLLSVGLLPLTLQYANNHRQNQPTAKQSTPAESDVALAPLPSTNLNTPLPGLTPPDNLPLLPPIDSTLPLPTSRLPAQPVLSPGAGISANSQTSAKSVLNVPQTAISAKNNPPSTASAKISGQQIALNPNLNLNPSQPVTKGEVALPQRRSLPPRLSSGTDNLSSNSLPAIPPPLATLPNESRSNNLPQRYSPTNQQLEEKINSSVPSSAADSNPFVDRLGDNPKTSAPPNVATGTIFDTAQIAEARSFFQKRWQPPSGLNQTLEYSLSLDVDGSIERILPLNKPAREFIDNTGIPAIGKPFVSANKSGQNIRIRVVFSPDGKVQTFSESE